MNDYISNADIISYVNYTDAFKVNEYRLVKISGTEKIAVLL